MSQVIKCEECKGTGVMDFHTDEGPYNREFQGDCVECNGAGEIKSFSAEQDEDV